MLASIIICLKSMSTVADVIMQVTRDIENWIISHEQQGWSHECTNLCWEWIKGEGFLMDDVSTFSYGKAEVKP